MAELELDVAANWERLPGVADRAQAFFRAAGGSAEYAAAMAMVTTELLENAIKYGLSGAVDVHLRLSLAAKEATVEVRNRVAADEHENLARLDDMVQWIRGFQDPFEAYTERLREVAAQRLDEAGSGLGLVRIAYEGRAVLDFIVDELGRLTVSAVRRD